MEDSVLVRLEDTHYFHNNFSCTGTAFHTILALRWPWCRRVPSRQPRLHCFKDHPP
jgi:hypothetical protein